MVFMEDSERAAAIAREKEVDAGLHLNLTTTFSEPGSATALVEHQHRVSRFLRLHRFAPIVYHPGLASSFEYVVAAQLNEFQRLYGREPNRIDGHHHMHLSANVILGRLLPKGTILRRNFSLAPGEVSLANRLYRKLIDRISSRRHCLPDYLFSLLPLEPAERLQRIFALACHSVVEVESHPVNPEEYRFLTEGEVFRHTGSVPIASCFAMPG